MRRSTYGLLWQVGITLLVTCYVLICSGCYGPRCMNGSWEYYDSRSRVHHVDTIIVNTPFSVHPSNTVLTK